MIYPSVISLEGNTFFSNHQNASFSIHNKSNPLSKRIHPHNQGINQKPQTSRKTERAVPSSQKNIERQLKKSRNQQNGNFCEKGKNYIFNKDKRVAQYLKRILNRMKFPEPSQKLPEPSQAKKKLFLNIQSMI